MAKLTFRLWALAAVAALGAPACGGSAVVTGGAGGGASAGSGNAVGTISGGSGASGGSGNASGLGGTGAVGAIGGTGAVGGSGAVSGAAGASDLAACSSNSECVVVPIGCCSCGSGPLSNYTAINSNYANQYNQRCAAVDCAPCPPGPVNPDDPAHYYVASCQAMPDIGKHCVAIDLGTRDITQCTSPADCTLRSGTGCCQGCGGSPVSININKESALEQLVCGPEPVGCPLCLPLFPDQTPTCNTGRCGFIESPCTEAHPCP